MAIVRAPGVNAAGDMGIRGWRAFCARCGYLTLPPASYNQCHAAMKRHRRVCPSKASNARP